jgi:NAD-dependent deacetylase
MGGLVQNQIIERLQYSRNSVVFTGAPVSADSGIPTFREAQTGLWERFEPGELATPAAFRRDPALVWGWYEWRRLQVLRARPNPAHIAIAELAKRAPKLSVITQNVDDLHERAGSTEVIHLHGSLHEPRCFACGRAYAGVVTDRTDQPGSERLEPPRCERCNGRVRPGVVWFGEALPEQSMRAALAAARDCDCLLSIGTSGVVMPAARIPEVALENGAAVIHINVQPVEVSAPGEFSVVGRAGELLPALLQQAFPTS